MPSWKKVVASGSDASFSSATVDTFVSASSFRGSFTGSLFGTASQAVSSSYAITASYLLGYASSFPFTGSAQITGSLGVTGSTTITGSTTVFGRLNINDSTKALLINGGSGFTATTYTVDITTGSAFGAALAVNGEVNIANGTYVDPFGGVAYDLKMGGAGNAIATRGRVSFDNGRVQTNGSGNLIVSGSTQITGSLGVTGSFSVTAPGGSSVFSSNADTLLITGSLIITGSGASITGSLNVSNGITGSLFGTASQAVSASYAFTASSATSASFAVNYLGSGSISTRLTNLETASGSFSTRVTNTEVTSSNLVAASGSFSTRVTQIERTYATTGSNIFTGSQNILGAITASAALINGTLTAQTLVVTTVSSSVVFSSGSNVFGNSTANTQTFTGSVNISGSLTLNGRATLNDLTGSLFGTASWATNFLTGSVTSASYAYTASSATNAFQSVSSSYAFTASSATNASASLIATSASYAYTASSAILASASLIATSASYAFTASSAISSSFAVNYLGSGSISTRLTNLETASGSLSTRVTNTETTSSNLVAASASFSTRITSDSSSLSIRTTNTEVTASNLVAASASFSSRVSSIEATTASLQLASASFSIRVTNTETTSSNLVAASASFSTRITNDSSSLSARETRTEATASSLVAASASFSTRTTNTEITSSNLVVASGSFSTRVTQIERTYATTGSNIFTGSQNILGAITASAALINGTLTAQTLVVTTVSSSVVFSSGSNIFGNSTANTQTFTGSVNISGSLNLVGRGTINDLTGSLFGTASQALTASYSLNAANAFIQGGNSFGAQAVLGTNDLQNLVLETNGTSRIFISSSGAYVGIGGITPSNGIPQALLDVNGLIRPRNGIQIIGDTITTVLSSSRSDNTQGGVLLFNGWGDYAFSNTLFVGYDSTTLAPIGLGQGNLFVRNRIAIGKTGSSAAFDVNGNAIITGSLIVLSGITGSLSGSVTGSLFGTSSQATSASYAFTASSAISSSFALTASYALNAGGSFPYTGSAQITGSLGVTGSFSVRGNQGSSVFSSNADTLLITGSLIITGSGASITGSLNVSSGITGSLFGTASQALTASYALGGDASAILYQTASAAFTWSFNHFLQTQYPVFTIYDNTNSVIVPQRIQAVDTASALIYFSSPTTGIAVASKGGYSSSVVTSAIIANTAITASFALSGTGTFSGSFSGSYQGALSGSLIGTASQAVSASYAFTASSAISSSYALTASFLLGGASGIGFPFTGSAQITGSLGVTGSLSVSAGITGSLSGSVTGSLFGTASFASTASFVNPLRQNVIISGSLTVSSSAIALSIQGSGSSVFSVDGTSGRLFEVDDSLSGSLFSVNTAAGLPVIEAFSDNTVRIGQFGQRALFVSQSRVGVGTETPTTNLDISGSGRFTNGLSLTGSVNSLNGYTGSLFGTSSQALTASFLLGSVISASYAFTASSASTAFSASFAATSSFANNFTVANQLTAQTLVVTTISSSVVFSSGSNIFGNSTANNQTFTGSVNISGSLTLVGRGTINDLTGSLFGTASQAQTASFVLNAVSSSYAFTASSAISSSYAFTASSATNATNALSASNFTITGTLNFDGTLTDYNAIASTSIGTNSVFAQATGSYRSGFFKYTAINGTNARTGEVMAAWNGANIVFTDFATTDIGATNDVTMSAALAAGTVQFNAITQGSGWNIRSIGTYM